MTSDEHVVDEEDFHERIQQIVNAATSAGIDVAGAWPVLNDEPDIPDWDIQIVELDRTDG